MHRFQLPGRNITDFKYLEFDSACGQLSSGKQPLKKYKLEPSSSRRHSDRLQILSKRRSILSPYEASRSSPLHPTREKSTFDNGFDASHGHENEEEQYRPRQSIVQFAPFNFRPHPYGRQNTPLSDATPVRSILKNCVTLKRAETSSHNQQQQNGEITEPPQQGKSVFRFPPFVHQRQHHSSNMNQIQQESCVEFDNEQVYRQQPQLQQRSSNQKQACSRNSHAQSDTVETPHQAESPPQNEQSFVAPEHPSQDDQQQSTATASASAAVNYLNIKKMIIV
uniref:Uncharacterized protein n=1 Tax=Panagrolaimus superbus TaxID=310955 RepID=A0A914Y4K7_9BILA